MAGKGVSALWLSLALAGAAFAQGAPTAAAPEARRAGQPWQAPELRHDGGVAYVSAAPAGRAEALQLGSDMNLRLDFMRADGAGVDDVAVAIVDSRGETVLDLASADAVLLARLEPGRYRVRATLHGETFEREVEVPAAGRRVESFAWRVPAPLARRR